MFITYYTQHRKTSVWIGMCFRWDNTATLFLFLPDDSPSSWTWEDVEIHRQSNTSWKSFVSTDPVNFENKRRTLGKKKNQKPSAQTGRAAKDLSLFLKATKFFIRTGEGLKGRFWSCRQGDNGARVWGVSVWFPLCSPYYLYSEVSSSQSTAGLKTIRGKIKKNKTKKKSKMNIFVHFVSASGKRDGKKPLCSWGKARPAVY